MIDLLLALAMAILPWLAPFQTVHVGVTRYRAPTGTRLACTGYTGRTYNVSHDWVAVPTEWVLSGLVACGDMVEITYPDGKRLWLPVEDTGCMLHWLVWDTGAPMAIDLPHHVANKYSVVTETAKVRVWSVDQQDWSDLSLLAWDTKHCEGPLTVDIPMLREIMKGGNFGTTFK